MLEVAVVTRQVCKLALHDQSANHWLLSKWASVHNVCLAPVVFRLMEHFGISPQARLSGRQGQAEQMKFMGHFHLTFVSYLRRRHLMIVWATSICCQSGQMISFVAEDNPVLSLSFHSIPHRQRGERVEAHRLLYLRAAWCLSGVPLQRPKPRSSSFWLSRLTHIWHGCVTKLQAFLDNTLGQGWMQRVRSTWVLDALSYVSVPCNPMVN